MNRRAFLHGAGTAGSAALWPGTGEGAGPRKRLKVTEVKIYRASVGSRHPVLVQVVTDAGLTGVGEAAVAYGTGAPAAAAMVKELAEDFILGKDPFRIEALWSEMYDHTFWAKGGGGPIIFAGISALEQALWDIKGKALGVPVYELLGGQVHDQVRVYANGWYGASIQPDEFARRAEAVAKDGYTALKFYPLATPVLDARGHRRLRHVTRRAVDRAAEELAVARVKAVRNAVGPKFDIMLDVSGGLTTDAMIRLGRQFAEYNILFLEEPVDPFNVDALKKVSEHVPIPIALGERLYTRYDFRRVLELQAADILQPDAGNTGGILEAKKIAAMAEVYNMRIQLHVYASPVSTAAALHVEAGLTNFFIHELYPYGGSEIFSLVDHAPELDVKNGFLPISDRPGLGIELVEKRVRPFLWARCQA
jgi:galactonate dehydratase